jgi:hypothetical protein
MDSKGEGIMEKEKGNKIKQKKGNKRRHEKKVTKNEELLCNLHTLFTKPSAKYKIKTAWSGRLCKTTTASVTLRCKAQLY